MDPTPYLRLAKLIERELELAAAGRIGELTEAIAERSAYAEGLPPAASPEAAAAVERARGMHARVLQETLRLQHELAARRRAHKRQIAVTRVYAPAGDRVSVSA